MRKITMTLALASLAMTATAQVDEEIISVGDRQLTVGQAYKITELPTTIDTVANEYEMTYKTIFKKEEVVYEPKPIKAAKLKVDAPLSKLYKGYIKAGIGLYTTPLIQARYNSLRSRKWAWGAHFDHFSSNGGLDNLPNSSYSDNNVDLWARHYMKKHTIEAGVNFDRNVNHFYGLDPASTETGFEEIDKKDIEQRYSTIDFRTALQSYYRDSSMIQHRITMGYRTTSTEWGSGEGSFRLGADLSKWEGVYNFGLGLSFETNAFTPVVDYRLRPGTGLDTIPVEIVKQTSTILDIHPSITTQLEDLKAEVGIGIVTDGAGDGTRFRFYPRAYVSYSLFDDLFTPYAGLTGRLKRNSMHSLSRENPFILQNIPLVNTSENYDVYVGIRGAILEDVSFNVKGSMVSYDDHQFFINDTTFSDENGFTVVYDDMKSLRLTGELTYEQSESLSLTAGVTLSSNTPDRLEQPYGLPSFEFTAGATYDLDDRFLVKLSLYSVSTRWGASPLADEFVAVQSDGYDDKKLKGYVDSNLSFEYRYTKKISAFLQFNNITGGKYQRFYRYPVQPFMVLGGVTYSF